MGLDCSHDAWHGAYSAFHRWRKKLAEVAGLPPLELMEGFFETAEEGLGGGTLYFGQLTDLWQEKVKLLEERLPIRWDCLKDRPLHILLYHSDCDGEIAQEDCGPIADDLESLLPLLPDEEAAGHIGHWRTKTQAFIDGLRKAAAAGQPLEFY
jgi:hypothetical protein